MKPVIVLLALLLAGCHSWAHLAAEQCTEIGLGPSHPEYGQCVATVLHDNQRRITAAGIVGASVLQTNQPRGFTCRQFGHTTQCY